MAENTLNSLLALSKRRWRRAFTLIELLIAVSIIGVLASIIYPYYADSVVEARRKNLLIELDNFVQAAERSFAVVGDFSEIDLQLPGRSDDGDVGRWPTEGDSYYELTLEISEDSSYFAIQATAKGNQTEDKNCLEISYDSIGLKEASDSSCLH